MQLLNSRYDCVAKNTIDYWMKKDSDRLSQRDVLNALKNAPWSERSTLQLYLHVPYCAQKCSFCAFSGGNSVDFKNAEKYSRLLVWQMKEMLSISNARGKRIASVNIGGGSPDLLKGHIDYVLKAVRDLAGYTDETEISVEFNLSTVTDEFIESLVENKVTKASFGVQVIDPTIRRYLHMPATLRNMDETCAKLARGVPIINADLMTGFPGQTIDSVVSDIEFFMNHPHVNSISTYLLTPGAAPKLIADIKSNTIPEQPSQAEQGLFRLHSYATLLRNGWVRKGTNTYMNPVKIPVDQLKIVAGNECIGARRYEDFLIGAGAQAISSVPGARIENTVDIDTWIASAEGKEQSFYLEKCSLEHQRDMALWVFPLMANGLAVDEYEEMCELNVLDDTQISQFNSFINEGLIVKSGSRYVLSITGEVFMGHLVQSLKKTTDQGVIDEYINEGYILGSLLADNKIPSKNFINDRQKFKILSIDTTDTKKCS